MFCYSVGVDFYPISYFTYLCIIFCIKFIPCPSLFRLCLFIISIILVTQFGPWWLKLLITSDCGSHE